MRVGILSLMQESNTFIQNETELSHFEEDLLLEGEEIRSTMENTHHEIGGFFQGLRDQKVEAVPIFMQGLFLWNGKFFGLHKTD